MSDRDRPLRRNFVVALVVHIVLITGIVLWEEFFPGGPRSSSAFVELVTPADIPGELTKGSGTGRGNYAPPKEPPGAREVAGPSEAMMPGDESLAPQPKSVSLPKSDPNEIALPKKRPAKKQVEAAKKPATTSKSKSATTTTGTSKAKATSTGTPPSVAEIRNRFAKALAAADDGTPYGDGKAAGGGKGTSGRIGSPTGSPDGMVGGVGQGSPFWQYYQHVHDQMYEAWEQPGDSLSQKLVAKVLIRVARDGTIADAALRNSSGNKLMDDSALTAARKVQRLEPPPDALVKGAFAEITIDFQVEG